MNTCLDLLEHPYIVSAMLGAFDKRTLYGCLYSCPYTNSYVCTKPERGSVSPFKISLSMKNASLHFSAEEYFSAPRTPHARCSPFIIYISFQIVPINFPRSFTAQWAQPETFGLYGSLTGGSRAARERERSCNCQNGRRGRPFPKVLEYPPDHCPHLNGDS